MDTSTVTSTATYPWGAQHWGDDVDQGGTQVDAVYKLTSDPTVPVTGGNPAAYNLVDPTAYTDPGIVPAANWATSGGAWTAPLRVSRSNAGWVQYTAQLPWFYQVRAPAQHGL